MKNIPVKVFFVLYGLLLLVNFFWFAAGGPVLQEESAFRIVVGSILIFLLPGLVWSEIIGFRSEHPYETVALSFALTITMETLLLAVVLLFHATMTVWVGMLFLACGAGLVVLLLQTMRGRELNFIPALWGAFRFRGPANAGTAVNVLIVFLISFGLYRWGEALFDIDGEKLLHFSLIRFYASLPLALPGLSVLKGYPPPNLVNFWEFLLAGWSSLVRIDPLVLAFRARFVIPLLGFSALFLLIKNIFTDRRRAELVFWGVLIMCLGWFGLLSPSPLDWVKTDPTRGIMSFMGTVHHADAAQEILLPLDAALVLVAFRMKGWRSLALLAGALSATFLWHTREFFQTLAYVGVFGITLLIMPQEEKRRLLLRWAKVLAVFIAVAVLFFALMAALVPPQSYGYDDLKLKEFALSYAVQHAMDFRSLFHFPVDVRLTQGLDRNTIVTNVQILELFQNSWVYFLWLILSALAVPVLVMLGDRNDRRLALFLVLLWALALCWGFSQFLLIALTYSEILFTTPRMIYLFSYIVTAAALVLIFDRLSQKVHRTRGLAVSAAVIAVAGLVLKLWWVAGVPGGDVVSGVLTVLFIVSFLVMVFSPPPQAPVEPSPSLFRIVLGVLLFFLPILGREYAVVVPKLLTMERPQVAWFDDGNPFGLSSRLIRFVRSLPPGRTFAVDPLGRAVLSLYAPQYSAVPPEILGRTVINVQGSYRRAMQGGDPLFGAGINHAAIIDELNRSGADFVLVERKYYPALLPYFSGHPEEYQLVFNNPGNGELVVRYLKGA